MKYTKRTHLAALLYFAQPERSPLVHQKLRDQRSRSITVAAQIREMRLEEDPALDVGSPRNQNQILDNASVLCYDAPRSCWFTYGRFRSAATASRRPR